MNNRIFVILLVSSFLCVFSSSCSYNRQVKNTINEVLLIGDEQPQKALSMLNSITDVNRMSEYNAMSYIAVKTWLKYRAGEDVSADTLIYKAADFFKDKKNARMNVLANFYSAAVSSANESWNKEFQYNLTTLPYAQQLNDSVMLGKLYYNIAWIYDQNYIDDSAIVYLEKSEKYLHSDISKINIKYFLTYLYTDTDKYKDIITQTKEALVLSKNVESSEDLSYQVFNLKLVSAISYKYLKQYDKTIQICKELENTPSDSLHTALIYLNLAQTYYNLSNKDSLEYYSLKLESYLPAVLHSKYSSVYNRKNVYTMLTKYYKTIGKEDVALMYANKDLDLCNEYEIAKDKQRLLFNINKETALNTQQKLLDDKYKNMILGGTIVLFCLMATVAIVAHYVGIQEEKRIIKKSIEFFYRFRKIPKNL